MRAADIKARALRRAKRDVATASALVAERMTELKSVIEGARGGSWPDSNRGIGQSVEDAVRSLAYAKQLVADIESGRYTEGW